MFFNTGWNNTIALTSTFLVAGNPITQQVYVYTLVLNPASAFLGTLTILDGSSLGSLFGLAVAVTGSTVAVVAPASQSVVTYTCTTSGSSTACTQSFILTSSLAPTCTKNILKETLFYFICHKHRLVWLQLCNQRRIGLRCHRRFSSGRTAW